MTFEKKALIKLCIEEMQSRVVEKEQKTFLGSTDRKTYTIQISLMWRKYHQNVYCDIPPWKEHHSQIVERALENAKQKFAEELYNKGVLKD